MGAKGEEPKVRRQSPRLEPVRRGRGGWRRDLALRRSWLKLPPSYRFLGPGARTFTAQSGFPVCEVGRAPEPLLGGSSESQLLFLGSSPGIHQAPLWPWGSAKLTGADWVLCKVLWQLGALGKQGLHWGRGKES